MMLEHAGEVLFDIFLTWIGFMSMTLFLAWLKYGRKRR